MSVTARQLRALETEFGPLDAVEVTAFGDQERMYIVNVPKCEYCGSLQPDANCRRCGAPARGVSHPAWRA